jgi:hypothetical protein
LCKDGVLKVGDYHFPKQSYDGAVSDYVAAYDQYLSEYGPPSLVYSRPGIAPVFPAVGATAPIEYVASWSADGLRVHVDLMLDGDLTGANWFAAVVISEETK